MKQKRLRARTGSQREGRTSVVASTLLALVLVAGSACSSRTDGSAETSGEAASGTATPDAGKNGADTNRASTNGAAERGKGSEGRTGSSPAAPLEMPPSTGTPGDGEPSRLPGLLPPEPVEPLASRPWPATAAARGEVVAGLPEGLAPVADSVVVSTSVSPAGDRLRAAVEATTRSSVPAVLRTYRKRWERHGLTPVQSPAAAGTRVMAYAHGSTTAVVTATRRKGTTRYWVHAVVHEEE